MTTNLKSGLAHSIRIDKLTIGPSRPQHTPHHAQHCYCQGAWLRPLRVQRATQKPSILELTQTLEADSNPAVVCALTGHERGFQSQSLCHHNLQSKNDGHPLENYCLEIYCILHKDCSTATLSILQRHFHSNTHHTGTHDMNMTRPRPDPDRDYTTPTHKRSSKHSKYY